MQRLGADVTRLAAGVQPSGDVDTNGPCGMPAIPVEKLAEGAIYCHAGVHYIGAVHYSDGIITLDHVERCPLSRAGDVRRKIGVERKRLAAEIESVEELSPFGWDGFRPDREGLEGGARALAVMRRFALKLDCNVLMVGPRGLGKSHLLLASHFELLERGVPSVYVRTPELRRIFRALDSYDQEVVEEAQRKLDPVLYASAVHFDDAGHIEDDARARGLFTEGLKDLLDRSRGRWATATNRTSAEAEKHPDLSGAVVSRLMQDAEVVKVDGVDFRALSARAG